MLHRWLWRVGACLVAAWLGLSLTACGGGGPAVAELHGWAHAGEALVGARVRILSLDGQELARAPQATHTTGTWYVEVPALPAAFTVEITGGTDGGRPFTGTLLHTERAHDELSPIAVNPATTLAAVYLRLHPNHSMASVDAAIRRFLSLPEDFELDRDLRGREFFFSGARFMAEVPPASGFDEHVLALAMALDKAVPASYAADRTRSTAQAGPASSKRALLVPSTPAPLWPGTTITADEVLQDEATIALAAATGGPEGAATAAGNILISKIFGGTSPDAAMMSMLQEINRKLDAMRSKIDEMSATLNRVENKVDKAAYAQQVAPLADLRTDIDKVQALYETITGSSDAAALISARRKFMAAMAETSFDGLDSRANRMKAGLDRIHTALVGSPDGGIDGALTLWNAVALTGKQAGPKRFASHDDQVYAQAAFKYWRRYQVMLYILVTEYGHAVAATNPDYLDDAWVGQYRPVDPTVTGTRFIEQSEAADGVDQLVPLAEGFLYDRVFGVVWAARLDGYGQDGYVHVDDRVGAWAASGLVYDGNALDTYYPLAIDRLARLSRLTEWAFPDMNMLKLLLRKQGNFMGAESYTSDTPGADYLIANGFGQWLKYQQPDQTWDGWMYAQAEHMPDWNGMYARRIVNINTGESYASCDGTGRTCDGKFFWRLTPGGFLAVHHRDGNLYLPRGW